MDAFLELKIFRNNCSTMLRMHFQPIEQCHMTMRTVIYMTFFITVFFHHSMHQIYHVLTYITVRNMVYIYIQCLNFLLYRGGGGCSAPVIMGPIAHVVQTALECTHLYVPVL